MRKKELGKHQSDAKRICSIHRAGGRGRGPNRSWQAKCAGVSTTTYYIKLYAAVIHPWLVKAEASLKIAGREGVYCALNVAMYYVVTICVAYYKKCFVFDSQPLTRAWSPGKTWCQPSLRVCSRSPSSPLSAFLLYKTSWNLL